MAEDLEISQFNILQGTHRVLFQNNDKVILMHSWTDIIHTSGNVSNLRHACIVHCDINKLSLFSKIDHQAILFFIKSLKHTLR